MENALKILGKTYALRFVDRVELEGGDPKETLMGLCSDGKQDIQVSIHQPPDALKDTLLHEIIHAIDYQMQLGLKERQVHCLASGLVAVFLDNPEFTQSWNNLNTEL
jgi:hypothetical protein